MVNLKRILVPHDYSTTSSAAVEYATQLARRLGADVLFLHVGERLPFDEYLAPQLGLNGVAGQQVRRAVEQHPLETGVLPTGSEFFERAGNPAEEIVRFAEENEVDLIVMGTHGRSGVAHLVMGSVAEKVVRTATCPVLTVRNAAAPATIPVLVGNGSVKSHSSIS